MKKAGKYFQPAIALMNRLKYPQKFALISSIFIIPLSLLMYLLLSEIKAGKNFAQKEIDGTAYLSHLSKLRVDVPRLKLLIDNSSNQNQQEITQTKSQINATLQSLENLVREHGPIVESRDQYLLPTIKDDLQNFQENQVTSTPKVKNQEYELLVNKINKLNGEVLNHSNLILDTDIDSYYLIDALLVKMSAIQELLGEIKMLAQKVIKNKQTTPKDRTELIIKLGFLQDSIEELAESMSVAFEHNYVANLDTNLKNNLSTFQKDTKQLTDLLGVLINNQKITNADSIFADAEKALKQSVTLLEQGIPQIDLLLQNRIDGLVKKEVLVYVLVLVILATVAYLLIGFYLGVMRTVANLSTASDLMLKGTFTETISLDNKDELAEVVKSFNNIGVALVEYSKEVFLLNERLNTENLRMKAELDLTREVQQMILPKEHELAEIPELDIVGFMQPASEIGGDYYDILHQDGRVKIGIGDVTGHGLESGILMLMVQTAVRTLLENNETDPTKFLNTLNRTIYHNVQRMKCDKNMTLCLLDYQDGKVRLSGQHEEMLVVRRGGLVQRIDTIDLGFPIGLEEEIGHLVGYADVQLYPGDVVVLYTDGITEAEDINGVQYGLKQLTEVVKENWQKSAQEIQQAVIDDLQKHIGEQKLLDDITLVVLKQKQQVANQAEELVLT